MIIVLEVYFLGVFSKLTFKIKPVPLAAGCIYQSSALRNTPPGLVLSCHLAMRSKTMGGFLALREYLRCARFLFFFPNLHFSWFLSSFTEGICEVEIRFYHFYAVFSLVESCLICCIFRAFAESCSHYLLEIRPLLPKLFERVLAYCWLPVHEVMMCHLDGLAQGHRASCGSPQGPFCQLPLLLYTLLCVQQSHWCRTRRWRCSYSGVANICHTRHSLHFPMRSLISSSPWGLDGMCCRIAENGMRCMLYVCWWLSRHRVDIFFEMLCLGNNGSEPTDSFLWRS